MFNDWYCQSKIHSLVNPFRWMSDWLVIHILHTDTEGQTTKATIVEHRIEKFVKNFKIYDIYKALVTYHPLWHDFKMQFVFHLIEVFKIKRFGIWSNMWEGNSFYWFLRTVLLDGFFYRLFFSLSWWWLKGFQVLVMMIYVGDFSYLVLSSGDCCFGVVFLVTFLEVERWKFTVFSLLLNKDSLALG